MRLLFLLTHGLPALVNAQFLIQTIAGTDFVGDNGPAPYSALRQPEGIAVDTAGNLYIADAGDHRIRKIATDGIIRTIAGTGRPGFSGDGGPAVSARLNQPYGVAVDPAGNVYIADLGNARVRKVSTDGRITTVAGGGTLSGSDAQGGPATAVRLESPRNVAVERSGVFYFSDFTGHRVYRVDVSGAIRIVAGSGIAGLSGDGAAGEFAALAYPAGLAVESTGALLIADSGNRRLRRASRGIIATVNLGTALFSPTGLSHDALGNLYIADAQLLKVSPAGLVSVVAGSARDVAVDDTGAVFLTTEALVRKVVSGSSTVAAGAGRYGYSGDGGAADLARFNRPCALAVASGGVIYIADERNHRVRRISASGTVTTIAGTGDAGFSGDGGLASLAQLNSPQGVAIDSDGNIYISDTGNSRVRRISTAGIITTFAGNGLRGTAIDGLPPAQTTLDTPAALVMDTDRNLYIADTSSNRVYRIDRYSSLTTVAAADRPRALAVDSEGALYIAETSRITRVTPDRAVSPVATGLHTPSGLVIHNGSIVVADTAAHQILRVSADGTLSLLAGAGQPGFSGDDGFASRAHLDTPTGLAVDEHGNILVADTGNDRIRKLVPVVGPEPIVQLRLVHAATLVEGPVAAGQILTLFGAPPTAEVYFGEIPGINLRADSDRIDVLVPLELAGRNTVPVEVRDAGRVLYRTGIVLAPSAIGVFTQPGGLAAALNEDGSVNSLLQPALRGSVVALFATGEGAGQEVALQIGGSEALILFAGPAPGCPGVFQVNARLPVGFFPRGLLEVSLKVGDSTSQAGVFLAVR